jgi:hypothetical protein
MWITKFQFDGSKMLFGKIAKENSAMLTGYPVSSYKKRKQLFVSLVGNVLGEETNKKRLLLSLKKSKYVKSIENNGNFLVLLLKEESSYEALYNPLFIYISPVEINSKGVCSYHIGSFERKPIEDLIKFIEHLFPGSFKLSFLKQEKINNVLLTNLSPNLTEKQRSAYKLAVNKGYYDYPKKVEINQLARLSKISPSTFQQHLRYAERKLSKFFVNL